MSSAGGRLGVRRLEPDERVEVSRGDVVVCIRLAGPVRFLRCLRRVLEHTPAESLEADVLVIACGPWSPDLARAVGVKLPIRPLSEIKEEVERICGGKPNRPLHSNHPVAVVKWVDGTVLDTVWQLG